MKPHIKRLVDAAHAEIVKELVEPGKAMTSPAVFADYAQQKMEKYKNSECLGILYCNSQNGVIGFEIEEKGEKFGAFCDPRRIAMACLEKATQGVFLAINHTSGDGMASKEDLSLTERVTVILGKLQIQCLDSAILKMGRGCYSMEEHGIMPTKNDQAIVSVGEYMAMPEGQIKQDGKMEEPSRALVEEARKALEEELRDPEVCVRRPVDVVPYIQLSLAHHLHRECFAVMFCDAQMNMIHWEEVFLGTIDGSAVYPREVARICLEHGAKNLILAHNHPSGTAKASTADIRITELLSGVMEVFGVRVADHIIVTPGREYCSLVEDGLFMLQERSESFVPSAGCQKPEEQQELWDR